MRISTGAPRRSGGKAHGSHGTAAAAGGNRKAVSSANTMIAQSRGNGKEQFESAAGTRLKNRGDPGQGDRIRPGAGSRRAPGKPGGGSERKPLSPAPFRRFASSHAGDAPRNGSPQKSEVLAGVRTECRSDQSPMPCCDRRPECRRRLAGGGHAFGTALTCRQNPDWTGGCPCASALSGGSRGFPSPPSFRGEKRRGDPDPPIPPQPPPPIPRDGSQGKGRSFLPGRPGASPPP